MFIKLRSRPHWSTDQEPEVVRLSHGDLAALGFEVENHDFAKWRVRSRVARLLVNGHLVGYDEFKMIKPGDVVSLLPVKSPNVKFVQYDGLDVAQIVGDMMTWFVMLFDGRSLEDPVPPFSQLTHFQRYCEDLPTVLP